MSGHSVALSIRQLHCQKCTKRLPGHTVWAKHPPSCSFFRHLGRALHSGVISGSPLGTQTGPALAHSDSQVVHPPSARFTSRTLRSIRSVLHRPPSHSLTACPEHTVPYTRTPSEAAVLIPLMNINGKPCVLLEKRSEELRVHAGEVSFPGGKADPTDESLAFAALREAHEELGLPPDHVEMLGLLDPPEYSLGNKARVWAFVGFVHDRPFHPVEAALASRDADKPLSSLYLSRLDPSPSEVSAMIPLPLSIMTEGPRRSIHFFRMDPNKPYWKYTVGDLVLPLNAKESHYGLAADSHGDSDLPLDTPPWQRKGKHIELWGLSGWFLHRLLYKMKWVTNPMET